MLRRVRSGPDGELKLGSLRHALVRDAETKAGCTARADLFAPDMILALGKLRNDAPAHSMEHTRRAVEDTLGAPLETFFEEFAPLPVASGTIAQVHPSALMPASMPVHASSQISQHLSMSACVCVAGDVCMCATAHVS